MQLTIVCTREGGMIRAGRRHGRAAEHLVTDFTPDQLRELIAEPNISVVVGRPLTPVDIAKIEEEQKAAAKAAARDANSIPPGECQTGAAGADDGAPAARRKAR